MQENFIQIVNFGEKISVLEPTNYKIHTLKKTVDYKSKREYQGRVVCLFQW